VKPAPESMAQVQDTSSKGLVGNDCWGGKVSEREVENAKGERQGATG